MSNVVIVGTQWGDEGKGKIVDLFTKHADVVVRFQGGNNAGHTLVVDGEQTILHLIPSGVLHPHVTCFIGSGVVVDPKTLLDEIALVKSKGFLKDDQLLVVSDNAHVIMPYHKQIDLLREAKRGKGKIGTTGRGIGPTYEDKVGRTGIRMGELVEPHLFRKRLEEILPEKNLYLEKVLGGKPIPFEELYKNYHEFGKKLKRYVRSNASVLTSPIQKKKNILFEGAQGVALDVDHGTYPFVTSSNTVAAAACIGVGIGPKSLDEVLGVCKAYTTRVGGGPFPTELHDETGEFLRREGKEFGATTGRPRRCGWLDLVLLRHAVRTCGLTGLIITKLDILSGQKSLKICVAYRYKGERLDEMPSSNHVMEECEPIYEELSGWSEPISQIRSLQKLPPQAKKYLERVEKEAGVPLCMISVGPSRDEQITIKTPFQKL